MLRRSGSIERGTAPAPPTMTALRAVVHPPWAMSWAAMRALTASEVARWRPEGVTMIGARAMSTRANPPTGSNRGSAAATRSSKGPTPLSVGSESEVAASASAKLSPATTITDFGHDRAPHQSLAPARVLSPPPVRSLVVYGKPPCPRRASVTARLVWNRSAPSRRSVWALPSRRGLAPGPTGHRLGCDAFVPSSATAAIAEPATAPKAIAPVRRRPASRRAHGIGGAP